MPEVLLLMRPSVVTFNYFSSLVRTQRHLYFLISFFTVNTHTFFRFSTPLNNRKSCFKSSSGSFFFCFLSPNKGRQTVSSFPSPHHIKTREPEPPSSLRSLTSLFYFHHGPRNQKNWVSKEIKREPLTPLEIAGTWGKKTYADTGTDKKNQGQKEGRVQR